MSPDGGSMKSAKRRPTSVRVHFVDIARAQGGNVDEGLTFGQDAPHRRLELLRGASTTGDAVGITARVRRDVSDHQSAGRHPLGGCDPANPDMIWSTTTSTPPTSEGICSCGTIVGGCTRWALGLQTSQHRIDVGGALDGRVPTTRDVHHP